MNKKLIRLTESDLHRIITEAVNNLLNEESPYEPKSSYLDALRRSYNTMKNKPSKQADYDFLNTLCPIFTPSKTTIRNLKYSADRDKERDGYDGKPLGLTGYNTRADLEKLKKDKEARLNLKNKKM